MSTMAIRDNSWQRMMRPLLGEDIERRIFDAYFVRFEEAVSAADVHRYLQRRYAADSEVTVEEVECIAACDLAPVLQVNYEFHGPLTDESASGLIDEYKQGKRVARTISGTRISGSPARSA